MNISYDIIGTLRAQEHGHPPLVFDARGNGGGEIAPTITGDHQNRITDYTAIVVEDEVVSNESIFNAENRPVQRIKSGIGFKGKRLQGCNRLDYWGG